jgi:hypothetical protein
MNTFSIFQNQKNKMKNLLKLILLIHLSTFFNTLKAQNCHWGDNDLPQEAAVLSIKVNYIDSFYVLNSILKVTGKEKIYLQKDSKFKDFFSRQNFDVADHDATLFLSKVVMNRLMIWAPDEKGTLYEPLYDFKGNRISTTSKMIGLMPTDSITVNVKLNNIYPLDLGYYNLYARIKVKYQGKWFYIYSDRLIFEVDKLPSKSATFHN